MFYNEKLFFLFHIRFRDTCKVAGKEDELMPFVKADVKKKAQKEKKRSGIPEGVGWNEKKKVTKKQKWITTSEQPGRDHAIQEWFPVWLNGKWLKAIHKALIPVGLP